MAEHFDANSEASLVEKFKLADSQNAAIYAKIINREQL